MGKRSKLTVNYLRNPSELNRTGQSFIIILINLSSMDNPVKPPQKNDSIARVVLKLPSVISRQDKVEIQRIGYVFDPTQRLLSTKQPIKLTQSTIGTAFPLIKEQVKRSLAIYEEKDWNNLQRDSSILSFEVEISVRIIMIGNPSIDVFPIVAGNASLYHTIDFDLTSASEESFREQINKESDKIIEQFNSSNFPQSLLPVSFCPQKLFNPHLFIKTQEKDKYQQYYTRGFYEYYHYGDQSFNDHGWGCAYRSLQTLLSWLSLQGHLPLPRMITIPQIQQLIDRINLGSRQKLRDSRQWIGATQVSWVVKHLTNIDCRILHISDGKKIIEECETIRDHFEKVGSPIMYGGGEYAYSIVGINYAWKLGECEFLILDPHYAGGDGLDKVMEKKGLCWRKPEEMFKKGVFYNFCMPIVT